MTLNGKRPQNIKSVIFQKRLLDLPKILIFSWGDETKSKICLKLRWPPMEDLTFWSEISQQPLIQSSSKFKGGDQTKIEYCLKWRRPQMEDTLQWKRTSKYWSGIFVQPLVGSSLNFKLWKKRKLNTDWHKDYIRLRTTSK